MVDFNKIKKFNNSINLYLCFKFTKFIKIPKPIQHIIIEQVLPKNILFLACKYYHDLKIMINTLDNHNSKYLFHYLQYNKQDGFKCIDNEIDHIFICTKHKYEEIDIDLICNIKYNNNVSLLIIDGEYYDNNAHNKLDIFMDIIPKKNIVAIGKIDEIFKKHKLKNVIEKQQQKVKFLNDQFRIYIDSLFR